MSLVSGVEAPAQGLRSAGHDDATVDIVAFKQ